MPTSPSTGSVSRPFDLLVVDDDSGDVLLIEEALADRHISHRLHTAGDGIDALRFLRESDQRRPDLILLDLNMPRMNGREFLAEVKSDPDLRPIPIVVLSTSTIDEDVAASYALRANAYVTKPVDFDDFISTVQCIDNFYLGTVRLPGHS
ncbi:response regulator [Cryptosporangium phraense]|uniref:Response regulator n=1 Tax=Cryptosporangium phraense TaxID=2593070 RepID=A0A545AEP2_9ACTN|nr:response regulator [Cryptosporangium phraense]TQS39807.1 response regulator [Cryptosporangium phraense]